MTISRLDRLRLESIDRRCTRLARETQALYHAAVRARMPLEILSAVARLAADIAAIHDRSFALSHPLEERP